MVESLPLVAWTICCFDKRREKPFPVYNRMFLLDWSQLTVDERTEILEILNDDSEVSKHGPQELGSVVVTLSRSRSEPDWRMLKFRKHFFLPNDEERDRNFQQAQAGMVGFKFVSLNAEYFEDENGQPMTSYEMIQYVSGMEHPIIIGDSKSVTRLGPSPPKSVEEWDSTKAATIAHFLDVVRRITESSWFRTPQSITYLTTQAKSDTNATEPSISTLLEALFPNDEQTTAILAYFRQLHAGDKLLAKASDTYINHCGDDRKAWWIEERKNHFEKLVDSEPAPFQIGSTRREIVRMFMYGAGLLHATSNNGDDQKLAEVIQIHGRHKAVAVFNNCLWDFLTVAAQAYNVIRQDYSSWISDHGLEGPGRDDIKTLFQGKTS